MNRPPRTGLPRPASPAVGMTRTPVTTPAQDTGHVHPAGADR